MKVCLGPLYVGPELHYMRGPGPRWRERNAMPTLVINLVADHEGEGNQDALRLAKDRSGSRSSNSGHIFASLLQQGC